MKMFKGLNPFEVREVLQDLHLAHAQICRSLNPFEVREVLQAVVAALVALVRVSIPLKSGRCCKNWRFNHENV